MLSEHTQNWNRSLNSDPELKKKMIVVAGGLESTEDMKVVPILQYLLIWCEYIIFVAACSTVSYLLDLFVIGVTCWN